MATPSQSELARQFLALHDGRKILVLPNAWDAASARIFEDAGFPAIGTSSAGIAFSLGYAGRAENLPRRNAGGGSAHRRRRAGSRDRRRGSRIRRHTRGRGPNRARRPGGRGRGDESGRHGAQPAGFTGGSESAIGKNSRRGRNFLARRGSLRLECAHGYFFGGNRSRRKRASRAPSSGSMPIGTPGRNPCSFLA